MHGPRNALRSFRSGKLRKEKREFIPCKSADHSLTACHANLRHGDLAQPSCNAGEEQVPRRMAKGVIDHLEPVKINEKQRRVTARRPRGKQTLYLSTETGPVGERSEEHTSELQSLMRISYAVFCLKKNKIYT